MPGLVPLLLKELPRETALKIFSSIARNVDTKIAEQICSFCGFLPLAIRACATRLAFTPDLEPRDYAAQLGDEKTRLETIANPEIGLNVETALNASYRFLNKEEARVFGQLVVFPGSWDADTEEYVCEDRSHRALSQLVRLALVSFDKANARYRLHDLVRLYAAGRSDPASDAVHERQSEYLAVRVVAKAVPRDRSMTHSPRLSQDANRNGETSKKGNHGQQKTSKEGRRQRVYVSSMRFHKTRFCSRPSCRPVNMFTGLKTA